MRELIIDHSQFIQIHEPESYVVRLIQPGCHLKLVGAFRLQPHQHITVAVTIQHEVPHTSAQTILKGTVKEWGHLRLYGKIHIFPDCGHTQSFLEERVLLLDRNAHAEAQPELEILSDDVKCSHAASVSAIPAEHMFYLQSRGLSQARAQKLLVDGFLTLPTN